MQRELSKLYVNLDLTTCVLILSPYETVRTANLNRWLLTWTVLTITSNVCPCQSMLNVTIKSTYDINCLLTLNRCQVGCIKNTKSTKLWGSLNAISQTWFEGRLVFTQRQDIAHIQHCDELVLSIADEFLSLYILIFSFIVHTCEETGRHFLASIYN